METTTATPRGCPAYERPATEVVFELLGDPVNGLTETEAAARLAGKGPNTLPEAHRRGPLLRFLLQFHSPLIYVLLVSAAITALLGEHVDASVILGVVIVNAIVGYAQESRAERALAALRALTQTTSTVIRDGQARRIPSTGLVVGDLVILEGGDKVPADLRLLRTESLRTDESALTGESAPVTKDPAALPGAALADRRNMAHSATLVTAGRGHGIVVATGTDTEIGLIHRLVDETTSVQTPLTRKIAHFSRLVTVAIVGLAVLTFVIGLLRGQPAAEMLTAAVALAVGAIPEGLPAVVTITLAFGVARMVHRSAIVRRLPAVETLGSTTVICTDKTGTLTENQMTVTLVAAGERLYEVDGTGYAPDGGLSSSAGPARLDAHPALAEILIAGLACNDAKVVRGDKGWQVVGDPTEGALVTSAAKAGLTTTSPRVGAVPFSSELQYMATLHADGTIYVKGSLERVLAMCDDRLDADARPAPLDRRQITGLADELAGRALRVLAFARATVRPGTGTLGPLPRLTFLGLQAMHDPPRPEAAQAVRACRRAGIQVKMITGDHIATAAAIGAQIGLDGAAMTGADLTACADHELPEAVERTEVFARVTPEQKLRLVRALQSRGHVIAMTGDGVNDAPALKQADIGIAMGRAGTEVAKESADMVLTDDNFASIKAAVEEGRGVFDNLVKFIVWALPANIGLGLVLMAAIITGSTLPILPVQVLWLNMTAVLILGLPFAVEPHDDDIMNRPPRDPGLPMLTRALVGRICLVSTILLIGAFGLFHWEQAHNASPAVARTVVVNVFALTLLSYLFNCLSLDRPMLWQGIRRNPWIAAGALALIAVQLAYTYIPTLNDLFRSAPLEPAAWILAALVALSSYAAVELTKALQQHRHKSPST